MDLDPTACYRAVEARDPRFDGRIFTAVRTTGIYCRPICPARTPKFENVTFYSTAAAAQAAGYRPCLRCRPETAPDLAAWQGRSRTVGRALALIGGGALDRDDASVRVVAERLGVGERQLRRLFREHLGAPPIAVAQTRRVLFAKQLIHETSMSMVDVALAAGFGSVRRFNETFRRLYGRPPSDLRRSGSGREAAATGSAITLTLAYDPPYDWDGTIAFLAARAIEGVELVEADRYRRTIEIGGGSGTLEVAPAVGRPALAATISFPDVRALPEIVARVRRVFDLAADSRAIASRLRDDPLLAPLVDASPGLRVPGAWDGFELGVRAILGQQVTVAAARGLAGRLVASYGNGVDSGVAGLEAAFPRAERLAGAAEGIAALGMPAARARSVAGLAAAFAADPALLERDLDPAATAARLTSLPGIGPWTAQYIALRALRDPDAFPAADVGLLRAATGPDGIRPSPAALLGRAEAWRPWRAYAAQLL
ncbi:MAG TPA: AlkA N-terminal domain-containing protein, partial [Candidatus Limnocylindrales bacterium]|nr:AlkA N-terminal domain-containing protein [Candidatus Limnocylindrales bacterium]